MHGYFGQALIVDLSTGTGRYEPLPDDVLERFIGGVRLHGGTQTQWMSERILAVPWWRVL